MAVISLEGVRTGLGCSRPVQRSRPWSSQCQTARAIQKILNVPREAYLLENFLHGEAFPVPALHLAWELLAKGSDALDEHVG